VTTFIGVLFLGVELGLLIGASSSFLVLLVENILSPTYADDHANCLELPRIASNCLNCL